MLACALARFSRDTFRQWRYHRSRPAMAATRLNISALEGNLSFGHFLSAAQQVSNIEVPHPAEPYLSAGFKPKKGQITGRHLLGA